jgi:hypothetical protein
MSASHWGFSSIGRALHLQCRGNGFESRILHMFTLAEWEAAIRLAKDARSAYKSHAISARELREKFNTIRYIIHEPELNNAHFNWLLEDLDD